ncbi:MAG TPA: M20/M25/M40 family metallo-hydrolase [Thermomicrobiales bacterium]|nr:M20/M25/M40 family metallo-hydrolase [Thermomicrobiales bacterium]
MDEQNKAFFRALITTPGPSGFEQAPARVWREQAETFADRVDRDNLGNSYAFVKGTAETDYTVVIEGHIDEIGFIITYIDDDGFLWFDRIGGWDEQVVVGQRIRIAGENGDVVGVIGKKAPHLMNPKDREKPSTFKDLWIDIGAADKDEAKAKVSVGDAAVIDGSPIEMTDDLWSSRSMDNRSGAYVALRATQLLAEERPQVNIVSVAAVQEEIGLVGATTLSWHIKPEVAIAIDVTHATDYPGANKKGDNDIRLGGGPVLGRGSSVNPNVFKGLRDAGRTLGITTPVQASGLRTGTDADNIIRSGANIAVGLISIPNRYMHSPSEMLSLTDLESAAKVIAEFVRTITPESDFRP